MIINPTKKQLRNERIVLQDVINRYGNILLRDAHDRVSVELDYYRGLVQSENRKATIVKRIT